MPRDQTTEVLTITGSLEATAEESSHRSEGAETEKEWNVWYKIQLQPGKDTDDDAVEYKVWVSPGVELSVGAGLDGEETGDWASDGAELLEEVGVHRGQ